MRNAIALFAPTGGEVSEPDCSRGQLWLRQVNVPSAAMVWVLSVHDDPQVGPVGGAEP